MAKVADPLELVEDSSDTLTDASVEDEDTSAVAGDELPELEREAEPLKLDVGETESTSAARVADGLLFELEAGSRGRDESPAETEPEPDEDEARALAQVAAIARSESWKTFMVFSGGGGGRARMVSLVRRFGWKSDYGESLLSGRWHQGHGIAEKHVEKEGNTETVNFQQKEIAMRLTSAMCVSYPSPPPKSTCARTCSIEVHVLYCAAWFQVQVLHSR